MTDMSPTEGVSVNLEELLLSCEWVSSSETAGLDAEAYISRSSGKIYWVGEGVDDEPPEDIEDESRYVPVPHKSELGLGRSLALRFVDLHLPHASETTREYFRKRGAYQRFKALLDQHGKLDDWHRHEQRAEEEALKEWCLDNGFVAVRKPDGG